MDSRGFQCPRRSFSSFVGLSLHNATSQSFSFTRARNTVDLRVQFPGNFRHDRMGVLTELRDRILLHRINVE